MQAPIDKAQLADGKSGHNQAADDKPSSGDVVGRGKTAARYRAALPSPSFPPSVSGTSSSSAEVLFPGQSGQLYSAKHLDGKLFTTQSGRILGAGWAAAGGASSSASSSVTLVLEDAKTHRKFSDGRNISGEAVGNDDNILISDEEDADSIELDFMSDYEFRVKDEWEPAPVQVDGKVTTVMNSMTLMASKTPKTQKPSYIYADSSFYGLDVEELKGPEDGFVLSTNTLMSPQFSDVLFSFNKKVVVPDQWCIACQHVDEVTKALDNFRGGFLLRVNYPRELKKRDHWIIPEIMSLNCTTLAQHIWQRTSSFAHSIGRPYEATPTIGTDEGFFVRIRRVKDREDRNISFRRDYKEKCYDREWLEENTQLVYLPFASCQPTPSKHLRDPAQAFATRHGWSATHSSNDNASSSTSTVASSRLKLDGFTAVKKIALRCVLAALEDNCAAFNMPVFQGCPYRKILTMEHMCLAVNVDNPSPLRTDRTVDETIVMIRMMEDYTGPCFGPAIDTLVVNPQTPTTVHMDPVEDYYPTAFQSMSVETAKNLWKSDSGYLFAHEVNLAERANTFEFVLSLNFAKIMYASFFWGFFGNLENFRVQVQPSKTEKTVFAAKECLDLMYEYYDLGKAIFNELSEENQKNVRDRFPFTAEALGPTLSRDNSRQLFFQYTPCYNRSAIPPSSAGSSGIRDIVTPGSARSDRRKKTKGGVAHGAEGVHKMSPVKEDDIKHNEESPPKSPRGAKRTADMMGSPPRVLSTKHTKLPTPSPVRHPQRGGKR